jgi:predicted aldo/keto reductase-like oxidoreductase
VKASGIGRRTFVRTGVAGLAGAAIAPVLPPQPNEVHLGSDAPAAKSIHRMLGKTGIRLPIISIGAVSFDPGLYHRALELGIRHIDTAPSYRNGNHERMLGQVFKGRPRDSFVVATSFSAESYVDRIKRIFKPNIPDRAVGSLEGSLRRLGLDYVDIYYVSGACSRATTLYEPHLKVLEKLKKEGKTRFVGIATHENEPEALRAAAESKFYDVVLTVYNFRQVHRVEMKRAIGQAARAGLGVVVMKTQAGASWDADSARRVPMTAALKWALQDENVHTAIPGITTYEQLEADLAIMGNLALTEAEKADLEKVGPLPYGLGNLFCQQCRKCVPQCPLGLEIPILMRAYMYAHGYRDPVRARETLEHLDLARLPCGDCAACYVRCAMGSDVRVRSMDVFRLKDVPDESLAYRDG